MCLEGRGSLWRGAHTGAGSRQDLLTKGNLTCCSSLFPKNYISWEEPHARAGEECEEEGNAVAKDYELTTILIPHSLCTALRVRSRRVGNERSQAQEGVMEPFLFITILLYFQLSIK